MLMCIGLQASHMFLLVSIFKPGQGICVFMCVCVQIWVTSVYELVKAWLQHTRHTYVYVYMFKPR